jgi:hypothetical protein
VGNGVLWQWVKFNLWNVVWYIVYLKCMPTFRYSLSVQNIRNTFLILSCTPFCPQNSLNSSHRLYKVSKAFHRDAGPCWLQSLPQLCQVGCIFFWVVDHYWFTRDTLSVKNPAALQFLTHSNLVRLAPTTMPCSKALFCLAYSPSEWHTWTFHVSIV